MWKGENPFALLKKICWEQLFFLTTLLLTTKGSLPKTLSKSTGIFSMSLALKLGPTETHFCPHFWFQAGVKPCHLVEIYINIIKAKGNTHLYFENWSSIHKAHLFCLYCACRTHPWNETFLMVKISPFFFLKLEWWKVLHGTTGSSCKLWNVQA